MEAVQSGSSIVVTSPDASAYEGDEYSYVSRVTYKPQSPSAVIYDEPDIVPTKSQRAQVKQNPTPAPAKYDEPTVISTQAQSVLQKQRKIYHPPPAAVMYDELMPAQSQIISQKQTKVKDASPTTAEYDEPILTPAQVYSVSQNQITTWIPLPTQSQPVTEEPESHEGGSDDDNDDADIYGDYPEELEQEDDDSYIEIAASIPSTPKRNATIPKKLESVTEISLENLSNLGPKQAQLWMLLNMQKMVQKMEKMEEVYGSTQPLSSKAERQSLTKPIPPPKPTLLCGKAEAPAPPNYPPPEEIEEIYDEDIGPELEMAAEPTRQDLYVNLDTINEAVEEDPPPPVPPRTYQHADEKDSYRNRTRSEVPLHYTRKVPSKPDHYAQPMVSKTLPLVRRSMILSGPSSMSAQNILPLDKCQSVSGKKYVPFDVW